MVGRDHIERVIWARLTSSVVTNIVSMQRMPKHVPEIWVSSPSPAVIDRDNHSDGGISEVVTDCETLDASYVRKSKEVKATQRKYEEDVLLTDVDASSDDERETVIRYPVDCINSILDLGMSCEEISNSQGPNKKQKSITCSLERGKPRTLNFEQFDDGSTDVEGLYMSEDEEMYKIDVHDAVDDFEPNAFVSISDKVVSGVIVSPRLTPEPGPMRKKRSPGGSPTPISSVLTDTEMLLSDAEGYSTHSKKLNKVKPYRTFGGVTSDTEDSDSPSSYSVRLNVKPTKKLSSSRSLDVIKHSKNTLLTNTKKKGCDTDQALTDTEHIYLNERSPEPIRHYQNRPSVIQTVHPAENCSTLRYRHNVAKTKIASVPPQNVSHKPLANSHKGKGSLNVPFNNDDGNATDIEAFGSDSDDMINEGQAVAYLPDPKYELVIANENHKGKISISMPISESQKKQTLTVKDVDCGTSDVEELSGCEGEDFFRFPTPDIPKMENSTVRNREAFVDKSYLHVDAGIQESVTDTEDLEVGPVHFGHTLKVKLAPQRRRNVSECHTDVEDLDGSDNERDEPVLNTDDVQTSDIGDLSSDDSDDDMYRFTASTPDIELNSTYTSAREAMSPFSFDVKRQMNEAVPKIRKISSSPLPTNTDTEDFMASQEESAGSAWASDEGHIEAHSSTIHIKHTRKFNIDDKEKLHIKGFVNRPDPTTDVEELTMLEALEELKQKKRKHQKNKEQNDVVGKICCAGSRGKPCKQNVRNQKSSGKHGIPSGNNSK